MGSPTLKIKARRNVFGVQRSCTLHCRMVGFSIVNTSDAQS